MNVADWLENLGLGRYAGAFADNDIDADTLGALTEDDLRELGVTSLGHRKKLMAAIAALGGVRAVEPAPAAAPHATPPHLEGERRQVTILFADLSGYTELSTRLDAEELRAVIDRVFAVVDRIVEDYGGTIDKHIGDEVMALFGAPIAHHDDPLRAVRAGIDIHEAISALATELGRDLSVHLGIASGSVVAGGVGEGARDEYTVLGDSVNLAARLNSRAKGGETLVSDAVRRAVAGRVECEALGEVEVKGFAEPVPIFRVRSLASTQDRSGEGTFVGRRSELRQFAGVIEGCRETGTGGTVVVRGEAGIGKTRLGQEFAAIAEADGFTVHRSLILDFGVGKDQDAMRALLRSLLGVEAGASDAERAKAADDAVKTALIDADAKPFLHDLLGLELSLEERTVYEAMDNEIRNAGKRSLMTSLIGRASAGSPQMLIVEDVHWADPLILSYLAALAYQVSLCPAVLLMTTRVEGDPLDIDWRATTRNSPLITIDLVPLRKEEAAEMARGFLSANEQVALASIERAEGNPLFLEQLLRSAEERGDEEIPASIQSLVLSRIDRLPPADKRALQAASVIGQRFSPAAVRFLIEDEDYGCRTLIEHHLVRPEGESFLFAHALIQEGVYSSLLNASKRQLHLRAADWYADRDLALSAQHLDRAGDEQAARAYLDAARAQAVEYHFDSALDLIRRGLELVGDTALRCELMELQGQMRYAVGDISGSVESFEAIFDVAENDAQRVPAWIGVAEAMRLVDRIEDGLAALEKAEAVAAASGHDLDLARIHHLRGNLLFPSGDYEACRIEHEKALAHAERAHSIELTARALGGLGDAYYASGHMLTAHDYIVRCLDLAEKNGFGSIEVAYTFMRGDAALFQGRLDLAIEDSRRSREMAVRVGNARAEVFAGWIDVTLVVFTDRFNQDEIASTLDRMEELIGQLGLKRVVALTSMGRAVLAARDGDFERTDALMRQSFAAAEESGVGFAGPWILAMHAWLTHDPEVRRRTLAEAEKLLDSQPSVSHNYIYSYMLAIEISIEDANWSDVNRYADLLETYMSREPTPLTDLVIARARALVRHAAGDRDPALAAELRALRAKAAEFGYDRALPTLDAALSDFETARRRAESD